MNIFMTGVTGYIGGSVAVGLTKDGHHIIGLTRRSDQAWHLNRIGIEPVIGDLSDRELLISEARRADAVINAADSDHAGAVQALLTALAGSGKPFIHTSGSSVVADDARGEPSDKIHTDDTLPEPAPAKAARAAVDKSVVAAAADHIRTSVICNALIYGEGTGLKKESIQIPALESQAKKSGIIRHVGKGLNIWSTVHIDDAIELYRLVLAGAPAGSFLFAENGEASFRDMTRALGRALKLGEPEPWSADAAIEEWGYGRALYSLGSNSRVRGKVSKGLLGWNPNHTSVAGWIESYYRL
jgi:nucleoside-diphosphate-sugar epimerase